MAQLMHPENRATSGTISTPPLATGLHLRESARDEYLAFQSGLPASTRTACEQEAIMERLAIVVPLRIEEFSAGEDRGIIFPTRHQNGPIRQRRGGMVFTLRTHTRRESPRT